MHSRIIHLVEDPQEEGYIGEERLFEWLNGRGVDYVVEMKDNSEAYDFLKDIGEIEEDILKVDVEKVDHLLLEDYLKFQKLTNEMDFTNFKDSYKIHELQRLLEDDLGLYIYTDYAGLITWQYFLRMVLMQHDRSPELLEWHIGEMYDYHF